MTSPNNARALAFDLLEAVEFDDAYANLLMPKLIAKANLATRDSAFAQELAYGTLRWQMFYDEVIEFAAGRPLEEIDESALIVLRLGAHQLLELETPPHAAISETVDLAKAVLPARLTGFVNACLRRISERTRNDWMQRVLAGFNDENDRFAIQYSHPVWIVKSLRHALKLDGREDQLEQLLKSDNSQPLVNLVYLPLKDERKTAIAGAVELGGVSPLGGILSSGDPSKLPEIQTGYARVQDQGSQLAALVLSRASKVKSGEKWADFCAGPGGKAALLAAEAATGAAHISCFEIAEHRTKLVDTALRHSIDHGVYDVTTADSRTLGAELPERFDRIMLDAPCSGLGALRRRPEARWRKSSRDIAELGTLQNELFDSAVAALKPGGLLAYVTCSPHPSETSAVIDGALKRHKNLELLNANAVLSQINPTLAATLNPSRKTAQLWPHVHKTDAMFIALLQKN